MKLVVGFSRPKSGFVPFAKAIMWYGNCDYSHAYLKITSESLERTLVYQASSTMVNFMGAELFNSKEIIVAEYEIDISDDKKKALLQFLVDKAGTPYGTLQCIGMILHRSLGIDLFKNGDEDFVCSELVARVLHGLDIPETFSNLDYVFPWDVRKMCDESTTFTRLR